MSSNGIWAQKSTFNAADAQQYDRLGIEVSISGDGNTIAAGAWGADTGPGSNANGGAIYIVKRGNPGYDSRLAVVWSMDINMESTS